MRLKAVIKVLVLVIATTLIAGYGFLYFRDYSRIKGLIEQAMLDASGRRLVIHGDLALSLSLTPALEVKDVTLANAGWGSKPQMVTIGLLRVRLKLLPLFKGEVKFKDIKLADTRILLETDASGQANWHFTPTNTARADLAISNLGVKRLLIDQLAVTFRGAESGVAEEHYSLDHLRLSNMPDKQSLAVELEGRSNGQTLSLSGKTGLLRELFSGSHFPLALSGEVAGARVSINGSIANVLTLTGIDLGLQASGSDVAPVGRTFRAGLPKTRRFDIQAQLEGDHDDLSARQLKGRFDLTGIELAVTGRIGDLSSLSEMQLEVTGGGDDLAQLGHAVGRALPSSGPFSVSGKISGTASDPALSDAQGAIGRQSLKLRLTGSISDLLNMEGIDLRVDGSGSDLAQLGPIIEHALPQTGAFSIGGKITGSATALALSEAQANVRHNKVKLSLTGKVSDLLALEGIELKWNGSGDSLAALNDALDVTLPRTGAFNATGRLTGSPVKFRLAALKGSIQHQQARLAITGKVEDLQQLQGIDLGFNGTGKDFSELGALFDTRLPDIGPFSLGGKLGGSRSLLDIKSFAANIGNSDFNGWSRIAFGKKPQITVKLESGLIDFTRIMDQLKDENEKKTARAGSAKQALFSKQPLPFELLDAVAADISLRARNIKARDAALQFGQLALRIDDGQLRMDTLEAVYKETRLSASLNARAGPPAHVSTRFLVQGFELGEFLKETNINHEVEAKADIAADLGSLGGSAHDLASNLDGVFAVVIGEGKMPRFLDILAEDLSRRVMSVWRSYKEAGNLNCGVVYFDIQQGVATSNTFLFDTQVGYLKGKGNINLATEQIDFLLSPHPKAVSLFNLKTKLRVSGSVMDPTVRPDAKSLAIQGSKALSTLVLGPAGLLGPFVSRGARNQHPCDMQALNGRLDKIYQ